MTDKKLEILVIEDNESHLADAKAEVQRRIDSGENINVEYVRDLHGYFALKDQGRTFDGIVSDIFFPTDLEKPYDNLANNLVWDVFGRDYVEKHADDYLSGDERREKMFKLVQDGWMDGEEIPPTGIVIADRAMKEGVPIVICTDTYHHGTKTQPVYDYAMNNRIHVVDSYDAGEGHDSHKDWEKAFNILLKLGGNK